MFRTGFLSIIRSLVLYTEDGHKTCSKRVEFYSRNKFDKLVNLVGFIISIYHDTRSSESQKRKAALSSIKISYKKWKIF